MITIYTKNKCPQCMMTKKFFDNKGVTYKELNLDTHPELIPELKEKGIATAPVRRFYCWFPTRKIQENCESDGGK